jgi:cytochrome c biogenesis protein CcmG/thiol:disulfide interchange protein DsbE
MHSRVPRCIALVFALACAVALSAIDPAAAAPKPAPVAPAIHLPGRTGDVDSDSLHAKVLLVDFWASWCVPCRRSFPWLAAMHTRYGEKGLVVVAVNLDKDRAAAEGFLARYPAPFRVGFDPQGKTAEAYRVNGMPSTYLVGSEGTVLLSHAGFDDKSAAMFEDRIARLLTP